MSHQSMDEYLRRLTRKGDNNGGWGDLPEKPTQLDYDNIEWKRYDYYPDLWEQCEHVNDYGEPKKDWRLKDPDDWWYYQRRMKKIENYREAVRWRATRVPKHMYEDRADYINRNGLGLVYMKPQLTDNLYSLHVKFQPGVKHLTNSLGQKKKEETAAGYHISLAYRDDVTKNTTLQRHMKWFLRKYFEKGHGEFFEIDKARVTRGSTYEFAGDDEFTRDLHELVQAGTNKQAHISLD